MNGHDVAPFATGDVEPVFAIGYHATSGGGNEIGFATPVGNPSSSATQISEMLDARVVLPLERVLVETCAASATGSFLTIHVLRQLAEMQPYLVHGAIARASSKAPSSALFAGAARGPSIRPPSEFAHPFVAGKRQLREGA